MSYSILKYKGLEIYCKQGSIDKYREGKITANDAVITEKIYIDVKKGNLAKDSDINKIFNVYDYQEQIKIMLENGEYSLTTDERRKKVDEKRKDIIS